MASNFESAPCQPRSEPSGSPLPDGKRTSLGLYVTAAEAYERWQLWPAKVRILDVRTPEEYLFIGHPEMAWNIPVALQSWEWDAVKGHFPMRLLPDFVDRVKEPFTPDLTLLVMCRSGGRSALAVNLLAQAGFKEAFNVTDGMEGDAVADPGSPNHGRRLVNGWKNAGLPWTCKIDPELMRLPRLP